MRIVATVAALLTLVAVFPPVATADDCAAPGAMSYCYPLGAQRPTLPPGFPAVPDTTYWGQYYLWVGAGRCATFDLNDCRGTPATPPVGVKLPPQVGGGTLGFGLFGVLYEETNGMEGLQRYWTSRPADRMVLL